MLSGISHYLPFISRMTTIGSRLAAVGIAGFGLKKLWSAEAQEKFSFTTRVAFSSTYALHITATAVATATFFDAAPLSPAVATALMCMTSLMINFSNFTEAYISQALLKSQFNSFKNQLQIHHLDLQRSMALIEGINDFDTQIKLLNEERQELTHIKHRLERVNSLLHNDKIEELIKIYLTLDEKYREKSEQNKIISTYFRSLPPNQTIDEALKDLHNQIIQTRNLIIQLRIEIQKHASPKTKARFQRKLNSHEEALKTFGIINIHCIRFKKIEEAIKQFQTQLKLQKNMVELKFIEERINHFKAILEKFFHLDEEDQMAELELGVTTTLKDLIQEDSATFIAKLHSILDKQLHSLEDKINAQTLGAEQIQYCFNLLVRHPSRDIQNHYQHIRQVTQAMADINKALSLENQRKNGNKAKINFSSTTSVLALLLCILPQEELITFIKPLMYTVGLLGSASSLWGFYQRNLLTQKTAIQTQSQVKRIEKEIEFKQTTMPRLMVDTKGRKILPTRAAKTKAKTAITPLYQSRTNIKKAKQITKTAGRKIRATLPHS